MKDKVEKLNPNIILIGKIFIAIVVIFSLSSIPWFYQMVSRGISVRESLLFEVCNVRSDFSMNDYEKYFTENFRNSNKFDSVKKLLPDDYFPLSYNCDRLNSKNPILWILDSAKIGSNSEKQLDAAYYYEYEPNSTDRVVFYYKEESGQLKVEYISGSWFGGYY